MRIPRFVWLSYYHDGRRKTSISLIINGLWLLGVHFFGRCWTAVNCFSIQLVAPQGFEPRYAAPEAAVLPLNEGAKLTYIGEPRRHQPSLHSKCCRVFGQRDACHLFVTENLQRLLPQNAMSSRSIPSRQQARQSAPPIATRECQSKRYGTSSL